VGEALVALEARRVGQGEVDDVCISEVLLAVEEHVRPEELVAVDACNHQHCAVVGGLGSRLVQVLVVVEPAGLGDAVVGDGCEVGDFVDAHIGGLLLPFANVVVVAGDALVGAGEGVGEEESEEQDLRGCYGQCICDCYHECIAGAFNYLSLMPYNYLLWLSLSCRCCCLT